LVGSDNIVTNSPIFSHLSFTENVIKLPLVDNYIIFLFTGYFSHFSRAMLGRARLCGSNLSVCPSVCLWRSGMFFTQVGILQKIISRPNSLRYLLTLTPVWAIWSNGNTSKIRAEYKNLQYLRNGARYDQAYYDRLIGSRIRAFSWYQNQWLWMTLNGRNVTLAEIK